MACPHQPVLLPHVVLNEVSGTQDGDRQVVSFDHPLDRHLAGKMRDIGIGLALEDRQVDEATNAGFAGRVERQHGLCELVGRVGRQEEKRRHALKRSTDAFNIGKVALDRRDIAGELRLFGRSGQGADLGAMPF